MSLAPACSPGPPRPAPSVSAQLTPAQLTPAQVTPAIPVTPPGLTAAQAPPSHHHAPNSDKMYTVNPPVGRFHESLWEIAHNHLGDGRRYREIFELNSDRVQPDGSRLTIASLIRPGWQLLMPKDAHGPGIEAVTPKLAGEPGLAGHPSQRGVGTEDPELPVGQAPGESAEITPDDDYSFADQLGAKYQADLRSRDHPGESRVKVTIHPTRINAVDMRG